MPNSGDRPPIAAAMEWVARIAAVSIEMVLPGLAGRWLDGRLGTEPLLTLAGFGLGIVGGIWHLLLMTSPPKKNCRPHDKDDPSLRD